MKCNMYTETWDMEDMEDMKDKTVDDKVVIGTRQLFLLFFFLNLW